MKKYLLLFTILAGLAFGSTASATLWDYYSERGLKLPSVQERAKEYTKVYKDVYHGTAFQNKALEAYFRGMVWIPEIDNLFGATPTPTSSASIKYVEAPDFYAYAPAVAGDTTITLNDLEDIYGNTLTMADFGNIGYGRIDPDGDEVSESFTFSGVTANSDGTFTLTGIKTVLAKYPYTQTSGLARSHSINAIVRFTNTASFYDNFANKENDEIIDGTWTFDGDNLPRVDSYTAPTLDTEFAPKKYIDDTAISGAPDGTETVKGIWEGATQAEMSAGTATGTTGAYLLLKSQYASSTSPSTTTVPITNTSGKLDDSWGGSAETLATLDANSLVVQNPANATSTPTADKIPIANASSTLHGGWVGASSTGDIIYYDGTYLQRLGIGTAGQVLQTNNGATAPEWATNYGLIFARYNKNVAIDYTGMEAAGSVANTGLESFGVAGASGTGADTMEVLLKAGATYGAELSSQAFSYSFPNSTGEYSELFTTMEVNKDDTGVTLYGSVGYFASDITATLSTTVTQNHAGFLFSDGSVYTSTANGTTQTLSSALSAISAYDEHDYRIVITSTQVLFYVDTVLKATHTTNLPTGNIGERAIVSFRNANDSTVLGEFFLKRPFAVLNVN
jgi:hypothetical protein